MASESDMNRFIEWLMADIPKQDRLACRGCGNLIYVSKGTAPETVLCHECKERQREREMKEQVRREAEIRRQKEAARQAADEQRRKQEEQERRNAAREAYEEAQRQADEKRRRQQEDRDRQRQQPSHALKDGAYYAHVLGLRGKISRDDVKRKYRELASQYHPDRVNHLGPKLKSVAEHEMKEINEAYEYFKDTYDIQ